MLGCPVPFDYASVVFANKALMDSVCRSCEGFDGSTIMAVEFA
jgi:hypothetical protein